jgi:two-component system, response regulator YesN
MRNVLIVEDERQIRLGLKKMIEELIGGYIVTGLASDGNEALRILEQSDPSLVITDIKMLGMGGLELIKEIRILHGELPIIILSGFAEFDLVKEALKYNVRDYLVKPVNRHELSVLLDRIFSSTERREETGGYSLIDRIRKIIYDNPAGDHSLRELALLLQMNPQYLSRMFKVKSGENLSSFIIKVRMEKAIHLLRTTNLKIYEVASLCGYPGVKYFTSLFKKTMGRTPSQVRIS